MRICLCVQRKRCQRFTTRGQSKHFISVAEKLQETAEGGWGGDCGRLSLLLCLQYKYSSPPVNQHGDLCDVSVARGAVSSCKQKLYRRTGFKSNKSQVAL